MTFTYRHKKELIMGLIILIIISISIFLIIKYRPKSKKESKKETIEKNIVEEKEKEEKIKAEKEARMIKECNEFNNLRNDACINTKSNKETKVEGKININTATKEELNTLPGIGSSKAKSIIEYREKVNGFKEIDELKKVEGIGEELFAKIKENIII